MSMSPQEFCDLLDELEIPTKVAAKKMGISMVTIQQYIHGRRYPSHGGGVITKLPRSIELLARTLKRHGR